MVLSDYAGFSCKGQEAVRILEGKMLKIAQILGISLEVRANEEFYTADDTPFCQICTADDTLITGTIWNSSLAKTR